MPNDIVTIHADILKVTKKFVTVSAPSAAWYRKSQVPGCGCTVFKKL